MSTKTQMKPLPKWFDGDVYTKGGTVENIITGEPAELNANELSMYDFICLLYTSPSPRDRQKSRMPSSA